MDKPKVQKPAETVASPEVGEKKEKKKHEDKKVKHQRPAQYERNADLITEETVLDPLPKKNEILQRPVLKDFQEREAKNREKITKLIEKKKQIFEERFKPNRPLVKGEGGVHQDFQNEIQEFNQLKERFNDLRTQRNQKRDLFAKLIEEAKANNNDLKKFKDSSKNCREYFEQQLEKFEHRLITDQLSKEEEKNLNSEIMVMKRKIKDSEPAGNVEVRIAKAEQRKQQLDAQIDRLKHDKEPLEVECRELKEKMDAKNAQIDKLKGDIKNESAQKTEAKEKNDKEYENWKEQKKKRVEETNQKIKELDEANKKIWIEYNEKNDAYWEQKHKLDFLEWQHRVKERKIRDKEREKRRQFAIEKEKEREKEQNLKKYIKEIELCNFLVNYLKDLTKDDKEVKEEQKVEEPKDINAKLGEDSQWKKEKGLVVVQSKKSKQDEEPVKKGKKSQKKTQKAEETGPKKFEIPFNIQMLFEQLKLLAPQSLEEVDKKIQEIKERESLFERACNEEVNQKDQQEIQKIKGTDKKEKKDKARTEKKQQDDFPTL